MDILQVIPEKGPDLWQIFTFLFGAGGILYAIITKKVASNKEKSETASIDIDVLKKKMDLPQLMENIENKLQAKFDARLRTIEKMELEKDLRHMEEIENYKKQIAELRLRHQKELDEAYKRINDLEGRIHDLETKI